MDLAVIRVLFVVVLTAACFFFRPFGLQPWTSAILGAVSAAAVIVFELRVRALSIKRLLGAVLGSVLGIAGAALFGMVLAGSLPPGGTRALLQLFVLMLMSYIGLMVGASKGDLLNFTGGLAELFAGERAAGRGEGGPRDPLADSAPRSPRPPRRGPLRFERAKASAQR